MKVGRVLAIVGLVVICGVGALAGLLVRSTMAAKYIEGTVVDSATGAPLAGVTVSVVNRGWGFSSGGLVWDKDYTYQAISDSAGRFRVEFSVGSSAHTIATKSGYHAYDDWHDRNTSITIRLRKQSQNAVALPHGVLELGMRNSRPYGWIFAEQRITFNRDEADVFPQFAGPPRDYIIEATLEAPGGITFLSNDQLGVSNDPLIYTDEAPAEGYLPSIRLDEQQGGIYFVKTRDGKFAKFTASFAAVGSQQDIQQGTWGLRFEYVYNPQGDRNLAFQR